MEIVFLGVGVVLGIVIGFFLGKRKPVDYKANQQDQQLLQAVQQEVHQLKSELKKADELKNDAEKNAAVIEQRLENAKENLLLNFFYPLYMNCMFIDQLKNLQKLTCI